MFKFDLFYFENMWNFDVSDGYYWRSFLKILRLGQSIIIL